MGFRNCLSASLSKDTPIRAGLDELITSGSPAAVLVAIDQAVAEIQAQKAEYRQQHAELVNGFHAESATSTPAYRFTSRGETDPGNELNDFLPVRGERLAINLAQRIKHFGEVLQDSLLSKRKIDKHEQAVLEDFHDNFLYRFDNALQRIFKQDKTEEFRYEDFVQYFPSKDGERTLPEVFRATIAAAAYEWLGSDGKLALSNDDDAIKRILGIDSKLSLPDGAAEHLMEIGISRDFLAKNIGRTIKERIGVKPGPNSTIEAEERLEISLGLLALATMEQLGYVERQLVYVGTDSEGNVNPEQRFGLEALQDGIQLTSDRVLSDPKQKYDPESGTAPRRTYIRIKTALRDRSGYRQLPAELSRIEALVKRGPKAMDKIFGSERARSNYSFSKPIYTKDKRAKTRKSNEALSIEQTDNLHKSNRKSYHKSKPVADLFMALDEDTRKQLVGYLDSASKMAHRDKSVRGTNLGIDRALNAFYAFLDQEEQREADGESTDIYIPAFFAKTMRMHQEGEINPQGSKIHRSLFSMGDWRVTFMPGKDTAMEELFFRALAFSFKEEALKIEGGLQKQADKAREFLAKNAAGKAISAVQYQLDGNALSAEMQQDIAAAVAEAGGGLHSLRGLVEYARYLQAKMDGVPFTTDLYNESDGIGNGPAIGMIQMITNRDDLRSVLATLTSHGFDFTQTDQDVTELLGSKQVLDGYERMGHAWVKQIEQRKQELADIAGDNTWQGRKARTKLYKMVAVEHLLGELTKDGRVTKEMRSLSKPRTMQTTFGAGPTKQINILVDEDIIESGIYDQLEKIAGEAAKLRDKPDTDQQDALQAKLRRLLNSLNVLLDAPVRTESNAQYLTAGMLDPAKILQVRVSPRQREKIHEHVKEHHGKAMQDAIDEIYGHSIAARKEFNRAIGLSVELYNTLLKAKVDAKIAAKLAADPQMVTDNEKIAAFNAALPAENAKRKAAGKPKLKRKELLKPTLTNAELAEITASLKDVFPKARTPFYRENAKGEGQNYYPLSAPDRKSNYTKTGKVTQRYASGTLSVQQEYASAVPLLKNPGVAPIINLIHMIDSMVANHVIGSDYDVLNTHDGFTASIDRMALVENRANERFYEVNTDYSLGVELARTYENSLDAFNKHLFAMGMSQAVLLETMMLEGYVSDRTISEMLGVFDYQEDEDIQAALKKSSKPKRAALLELIQARSLSDAMIADFLASDLKQLGVSIGQQAQEMHDNKAEVMRAVQKMHQYAGNGDGVKTGNEYTGTLFAGTKKAIKISSLLSTDKRRATQTAKEITATQNGMQELVSTLTLGSTNVNGVSQTETDYPSSADIDGQNVVQVFDSLNRVEQANGHATVTESPEHENYLRNLLDSMVSRVMRPVQLFNMTRPLNDNDETMGVYTTTEGQAPKVFIQTQADTGTAPSGFLAQGLRMSTGQVYAHELVHHITHAGLRLNRHLLRQVMALHKKTQKALEARYPGEAFRAMLNDPAIDVTDPAHEFEVAAAKARYDYIFEPNQQVHALKHGRLTQDKTLDIYDEFVALGLTNENFMRELQQISIDASIPTIKNSVVGMFSRDIQTTLVNIFNRIMDLLHQTYYDQRHGKTAAAELHYLADALAAVDSKQKSWLFAMADNGEKWLTAKSAFIDEKAKGLVRAVPLVRAVNIIREIPEANNAFAQQLREIRGWYNDREYGLLASVATEIKGNTSRVAKLHELLHYRDIVLDKTKQAESATMKQVLASLFDRKLTKEEKTALTKAALKTDLSSLLGPSSMPAIRGFVADGSLRVQRIQQLEAQLLADPALATHVPYFKVASDVLGYYMVTGRGRDGELVMHNAHNIASLTETAHAGTLTPDQQEKARQIVDQLATLRALGYVSVAHRQQLSQLLTEQPAGVEGVLAQHNLIKEAAFTSSFNSNPAKMLKGYTKSILNPRTRFAWGTLADKQKYLDAGYTMHMTPLKRDPNDPVKEDIYIFKSSMGSDNDLAPGIVSFTRNAAMGSSSVDIQKQLGNNTNPGLIGYRNNTRVIDAARAILGFMANGPQANRATTRDTLSYMIPVFNDKGEISSMRYIMPESSKDGLLEQNNDYDAIMGGMAEQIVDKRETPRINEQAMIALKQMYDADYQNNPTAYVEISAFSREKRYQDIWNMLPPKAQAQARTLWQGRPMMVSKDVIDLAFGGRKYSTLEAFGKTRAERNWFEKLMTETAYAVLGMNFKGSADTRSDKGRTLNRVKYIEDNLKMLAKLVKTNIVVRNFAVTRGNWGSNVMYLKSKGIPLSDISRLSREAMISAIEYQKDKSALDKLVALRAIEEKRTSVNQATRDARIKKIDRKIADLEHLLAVNPSTAMMEAGLIPTITDDVDLSDNNQDYAYGVDAGLNWVLDKLPGKTQNVGRTLFMTTDTEGYKILNNAVKMTDYMGRYVLYKKYTKEGMGHDAAIAAVNEEFVNFELPTHRMIEYGNNIGLIWFSKFALRVLKPMASMVAEKPFTALATFALSTAAGMSNILGSIPGVTKDMLQAFGDPVSALTDSIGEITLLDLVDGPLE